MNNNCMTDSNDTNYINIDVKQLSLKKTKEKITEHKKNYVIFKNDSTKIKIQLKGVFLPFGTESYNKKYVLNIEIYPKKSNEHYNIHSSLFSFENELQNITNFSNDVKSSIDGCGYYSFIKKNDKGYLIRTYFSAYPEIYRMIGKFKNTLTSNDLKGVTCNVDLELGTFWTTDNSYGVIWYVKKIEVI